MRRNHADERLCRRNSDRSIPQLRRRGQYAARGRDRKENAVRDRRVCRRFAGGRWVIGQRYE